MTEFAVETCGPYKILNQLGAEDGAISYLARGPEGEVTLTIFPPGNDEVARQCIELQEKAAAVSPHVAPVIQRGTCEDGEWYSSRVYPRSLQKLLEGRVALSKLWILQILLAVTRGALAFKTAGGRGHGNLQPHNILLSGSTTIKEAEIVIKDPRCDEEGASTELRDLKAIGLTLFQLVRRRETDERSIILPLESSPEWKAVFGKDADKWLGLCNRLLQPNLSLGHYNLERLEQELLSLEPKPPVSRKQLVAAAAFALCAMVAGVAIVWMKGQATLEVTSNLPGATVTVRGPKAKTFVVKGEPVAVKVRKGSYVVEGVRGDFTASTNVIITGGKQQVALQFEFATLSIETVFESEDGTRRSEPFTNLYVRPGSVTYQVMLAGYDSTTVSERLAAGEVKTVQAKMVKPSADKVAVEVQSTPLDAEVEIRDRAQALVVRERTGGRKSLLPGEYRVIVSYQGLVAQTNDITLRAGEPRTGRNALTFNFPTAPLAFDAMDGTKVIAAKVWRGTNYVGLSTDPPKRWPIGRWTFRLAADGYDETNVTLVVQQEDVLVRHAQALNAIVGVVYVTSDPQTGVRFGTNQTELSWKTPHTAILSPGAHTFYASHEELGAIKLPIEVSRGQTNVALKYPYGIVAWTANLNPALVRHPLDSRRELSTNSILPPGRYAVTAVHLGARPPLTNTQLLVVEEQHKANPLHCRFNFEYGEVILTSAPLGPDVYDEQWQLIGALREGKDQAFQLKAPVGNRIYFFKGMVGDRLTTNSTNITITAGQSPYRIVMDFKAPTNHKIPMKGTELELVFIPGLDYFVGKYEVTQLQYQNIMGINPSPSKLGPNYPVDSVTWQAADEYCKRLNAADGSRPPGFNYTLPSFDQWRAYVGSAITDVTKAVIKAINAAPVGSKPPNEYGLYDVRGNVWEWTLKAEPVGGSYKSPGLSATAFLKQIIPNANHTDEMIGFRVLLVRDPKLAKN